jgi:hypothetical protein
MDRGADIRIVAQGFPAPDQRHAHERVAGLASAQAANESSVNNQSAGIMMP